jgi:hypothetical protein
MMKFSWWTAGRTRLALATAGSVVIASLAACGPDAESVPLIKATIKVASITQQGGCEDVNIKVTPLELLPGAPQLANNREFVTPVKLIKGADNVSCTGEASTIPMAPGKWKFTANLPSEIASCDRDIKSGANLGVGFKDGELTCS